MFNEKNIFIRIKENSSSNNDSVTLPEPNKPDTFEKGVNPEK